MLQTSGNLEEKVKALNSETGDISVVEEVGKLGRQLMGESWTEREGFQLLSCARVFLAFETSGAH